MTPVLDIALSPGDLPAASGVVPTHEGLVQVEWTRRDDKIEMRLVADERLRLRNGGGLHVAARTTLVLGSDPAGVYRWLRPEGALF